MNYHLSRRSFIYLTTATSLSQLLSGCGNPDRIVQILFLDNSVPLQLIGDFRQAVGKENKINFQPQTQSSQTFASLLNLSTAKQADEGANNLWNKIFNKSKSLPDLSSMGDSWLNSAIARNLLQPLKIENLTNWQKLPPRWQQLVRRDLRGNLTADGEIYGAPYRWGSTIIAYRSDKLDQLELSIQDWQDLWQPELRGRISLLDSPRETIGLTLKKSGYSYNTENIEAIANLEAELLALHQQTKFYSSDRYLEPLILGDTWAAVGWSSDILSVAKRYPEIKYIIPQSGVSLWVDLWVKPNLTARETEEDIASIANDWIDFCWTEKAAKQISLFTRGISPLLLTSKPEDLPKDLQDDIWLNSEVIKSDKSEFLLPQTLETQQQYKNLWLKIRRS